LGRTRLGLGFTILNKRPILIRVNNLFLALASVRFLIGTAIMAVSQDLLDILVCPLCKASLTLVSAGSGLKCSQCRRVYPIRENIPVMLIDEATIDPEPS
jgi:uncharacterized protein YbaR (Trm112 family)